MDGLGGQPPMAPLPGGSLPATQPDLGAMPGMMGADAGLTGPGATPTLDAAASGNLDAAIAGGAAPVAGAGGAVAASSNNYSTMLGDQSPFMVRVANQQPNPPDPRLASKIVPSVRGFKIAENMSPIPQDRIFFGFNFYDQLSQDLNEFFESPLKDIRYYRYVFGFEKTFNEGKGSVGLRLPLNTLYAKSVNPRLAAGGHSTSLGNLTIFTKYILGQNPRTGSLVTVGLALTPPTGPDRLAGANFVRGLNTTTFQPFLGYFLPVGRRGWIHGFTAVDVPMNIQDATMAYNDIGINYFLFRSQEPYDYLTAIVPTFEVHVNNPLNHRNEYSFRDLNGVPDVVNLTFGVNFEFFRSSVLTMGIATPVTGPRPFDLEALVLFNVRFGGSRNLPIFPIIGG
jgi:hypothetical protein